jgi:general secretion pathway protein K
MSTQRGAALLLVLWALALLSALMASALATVRLENRQSRYALHRVQALSNAEAGVVLAVEGLLAPAKTAWLADGQAYALTFDGATLQVRIESERGKLDINSADTALYPPLMTELGASARQIQQFTQTLESKRLAHQLIVSLEDLQAFAGMTPALYQQLLPNVTLWSGTNTLSPSFATPALRKALALTGPPDLSDPGQVFTIRSRARLENDFSAELAVTLQLSANDLNAPLYRVFRWRE